MLTTWQTYQRDHARSIDAALALLLFGLSFSGSTITFQGGASSVPWWPAVLLTGVSCAALLWRRDHPRTVVAVVTGCAVGVAALGYLLTVLLLGPVMVGLFALAFRTDRRTANTYTLVTIGLLVVTAMAAGPAAEPLVLKTIAPAAWLLLPTSLGTVARMRSEYLEAAQTRAEQAERTREELARHRVAEERMRIARELHDVVAHHLALANAQAGTAAHVVRNRPDQAQQMLAELSATTSSALRELKAAVGLLRQTDDPEAPLEPAPGLARLPDLVAALSAAGLDVTVTVADGGPPRALSPGADLTAYRIVQEALTNVTKHAGTKEARVELAYSHEWLSIAVTDQGAGPPARRPSAPAAPAPDSGFGLIGMRERAHSVGGRLRTGPRPDGGFQVLAELPLPSRAPKDPSPKEDTAS
ncbi:sensor histidine kinase [Streptacidiphilus sp. N1-10]|uniref:histidine kinase n=1 Tax=Streptacidiphilus jeojiensis TaxID=3229225 RepID=A0ABV6XHN6_9ACTN